MRCLAFVLAVSLMAPSLAGAQELEAAPPLTRLFGQEPYTEYALLDDPKTASFRILYMPIERRSGAEILVNGTRHGSDGGEISVWNPRTGEPLDFEYVSGDEAIARKLPGSFTPEDHYIVARLPWPVPEGGEGRVVIEKTYKDPRTYYAEGPDDIVWVRALSPMRFGIVLPLGYSVSSMDVAAQMMTLPDGRLKLALTNPSGGGSPLTLRASKTGTPFAANSIPDKVREDVKTLYDLAEPGTRSFRVEQTYSDDRKGEKARLDVLGELPLEDIEVIDLDTAKPLRTVREGDSSFAVLELPIVRERQSAHLRVRGRAEDSGYRLENGDLVFERTLHGLRNTVLLPGGWDVSGVSQPGTVGTHEGRTFVSFIDIRVEDEMKVQIRARRRARDAPTH